MIDENCKLKCSTSLFKIFLNATFIFGQSVQYICTRQSKWLSLFAVHCLLL